MREMEQLTGYPVSRGSRSGPKPRGVGINSGTNLSASVPSSEQDDVPDSAWNRPRPTCAVDLITRRSRVQIPPPLLTKPRDCEVSSFRVGNALQGRASIGHQIMVPSPASS